MSIAFATKLSALRREKNMTQKACADALGISQALLSHYEKGIRECNLDFLVKAANYYDVTTDYLLGRSEFRHGSNTAIEDNILESDSQIKALTISRAILYLMNNSEKSIQATENFNNFFSLAVKKYITLLGDSKSSIIPIIDLTQNTTQSTDASLLSESLPLYIETIDSHSSDLIKEYLNNLTK